MYRRLGTVVGAMTGHGRPNRRCAIGRTHKCHATGYGQRATTGYTTTSLNIPAPSGTSPFSGSCGQFGGPPSSFGSAGGPPVATEPGLAKESPQPCR